MQIIRGLAARERPTIVLSHVANESPSFEHCIQLDIPWICRISQCGTGLLNMERGLLHGVVFGLFS